MNGGHLGQEHLHLVGLQMSDEMKSRIGDSERSEFAGFGHQLLYEILTKIPLALPVKFEHFLDGLELADRQ
jgi:hypothetical protein